MPAPIPLQPTEPDAHRLELVKTLKPLPAQSSLKDGQYVIKSVNEAKRKAKDDQLRSRVWFQTPPLDLATIRRINSLQLFAESHDQGFVDVPEAGNWTWFELAILEDASATSPRVKDGIDLVWVSHGNRSGKDDWGWGQGEVFDEHHDLLRLLEEGNVIAVRICARFPGWKIFARTGYLVVDIGHKIDREPLEYGQIVSELKNIQETINEVNIHTDAAFKPSISGNLFRADVFSTGGERPLRVLSLDGGGVRGLSSLRLLKAVMEKAAPGKKPCEVFDLIGGTSTGGLIAIMLGRLQMTIDECIVKYQDFMRKIFKTGWFGKYVDFVKRGEFYDASVLESVIKELIREKLGRDDVELLDESNPCKIFVMAVRKEAANNRGPVFLRSYRNPQDISLLPNIKLWEAARATSAAPAYFAPIKVGDVELIDGGLGANNPLGWLWTEIAGVFGPARPTACFLSIGTGIPANQALPKIGKLGSHDVEGALASIATNSQLVNVLFRTLINAFAPQAIKKKYWRLNIGDEIPDWDEEAGRWKSQIKEKDNYPDVGDLDNLDLVEKLRVLTEQYIAEQGAGIEECATALKTEL